MCADLGLARLIKNLMFYENDKKNGCALSSTSIFYSYTEIILD